MAAGGRPVRSASSRSAPSSSSSGANSDTMYSERWSNATRARLKKAADEPLGRRNDPAGLLDADVPGLFEILLGVGPERRERLRSLDRRNLRETLRHDLCDLLILRDLHDRDQIPLARHGVDLLNPVDAGELDGRLRDPLRVSLDQDDGGDHWPSGNGGTA